MIMNSYTILRKLDAVGRLVLPLDMRRDLCLEPGGCVRVTLDKQGAGLLLEKASCAGSEKFLMELDGLGRIVIPQALRAALEAKANTTMELTCDPASVSVVLRPVKPACCACGGGDDLKPVGSAPLCRSCRCEVLALGE